ncbi:MAG: peptidylprolyl isomerase [Spirochaetes bacterium]|nr:peptidylprolyl isomerase [Spirochaetota bacterium]
MSDELIAIIRTNKGNIRLRLFHEKAPITVANFVNLVHHGFYNGLTFHRVISNFMIQTGRPGKERDNAGYHFDDEFHPELRHCKPGILSMANKGPNSNSSQIFITHIATPDLDDMHSVFGEVINESSQKVVNAIKAGDQILEIELRGDYSKVFTKAKDYIDQWNQIINQNKAKKLFP